MASFWKELLHIGTPPGLQETPKEIPNRDWENVGDYLQNAMNKIDAEITQKPTRQ